MRPETTVWLNRHTICAICAKHSGKWLHRHRQMIVMPETTIRLNRHTISAKHSGKWWHRHRQMMVRSEAIIWLNRHTISAKHPGKVLHRHRQMMVKPETIICSIDTQYVLSILENGCTGIDKWWWDQKLFTFSEEPNILVETVK